MEETLHNLVQLLIKAIPTIVFFVFLTVYLNLMYFRPMAKLLEERRRQTEGSRDLAQRAFDAADQKQSEFERALQLARADISQANDALRRQWAEEETEILAKARADHEARIAQAKASLSEEIERAMSDLDVNVEGLSTKIVEALAGRRAA